MTGLADRRTARHGRAGEGTRGGRRLGDTQVGRDEAAGGRGEGARRLGGRCTHRCGRGVRGAGSSRSGSCRGSGSSGGQSGRGAGAARHAACGAGRRPS
jgi:hypothetical protein